MKNWTQEEQLHSTLSDAFNARQIANAKFAKNVEQAMAERTKFLSKHEANIKSILDLYKDTAVKVAVLQKRYVADDVGLPKNPDRMSVLEEGIRLEWDYEDRGYTEVMVVIPTWESIFEIQKPD
jgi:hypothetical protein